MIKGTPRLERRLLDEAFPNIDHVLDVGCGDLVFWEGCDCEDYVGIDISNVVNQRNRIARPKWVFITSPAEVYISGLHAETVLCMDVLFHINKYEDFMRIINNLTRYADKRLILSVWMESPFKEGNSDGLYQFYHPFDEPLVTEKGFKSVKRIQIKMFSAEPVDPKSILKDAMYKALYIFERA